MAQIRSIITTRALKKWPTWLMVHEWEDVLAKALPAGLRPLTENCLVSDPTYGQDEFDLMFLQLADELRYFVGNGHLIPIIMDLWRNDYETFLKHAVNFRLIYVTCLQVYREMQAQGLANVRYLPFSVADPYLSWTLPAKEIDIIQFGRTNPLLDAYMDVFLGRHPKVNYVTTFTSDRKVIFLSSRHGVMYESDTRAIFMNTLARSTISLVSTVGMDGSRDTGGIDPVSPRFFESMAAGCHLVGRIPDNEEFSLLGIAPHCWHLDSYEAFEGTVLHLLQGGFDRRTGYARLLRGHATSVRAARLLDDLADISSR